MLIWLTILGCGPEEIAFPPGLEPLPAQNTAEWPANQAEAINTNSGEDGDVVWTHGRGYIRSDLGSVYPCLQEPEINLDRREVAEWSVIPLEDDAYDSTYILDILVENIVDVEYEVALPDEEQMQQYLNDVHTELIACVAGDPLPSYD